MEDPEVKQTQVYKKKKNHQTGKEMYDNRLKADGDRNADEIETITKFKQEQLKTD